MLLNSAAHEVTYDQQVYVLSEAQAAQHQSYIHHFLHSAVQSLHICQPQYSEAKY